MQEFEPGSAWVPLGDGWITAVGAPSRHRLTGWVGRGATAVLTLQRGDEMQPWLPELCRAQGLAWWHLPLSGRRMEQQADRESLSRLPAVLAGWGSHRGVVHCSAGLHRTGAICYALLRLSGLDREAAAARVREARALTGEELCREVASGALVDRVERHLQDTSARYGQAPVFP